MVHRGPSSPRLAMVVIALVILYILHTEINTDIVLIHSFMVSERGIVWCTVNPSYSDT